MFKRNQLSLLLLTIVLMLTVYYLNTPDNTPNDGENLPGNQEEEVFVKTAQFANLRLDLESTRDSAIAQYQAVIANNASTDDQKRAALDEINNLYDTTAQELLLETKIIDKGYRDAFVHSMDSGINISIIADEHSIERANEIILLAKSDFGVDVEVFITFLPVVSDT